MTRRNYRTLLAPNLADRRTAVALASGFQEALVGDGRKPQQQGGKPQSNAALPQPGQDRPYVIF